MKKLFIFMIVLFTVGCTYDMSKSEHYTTENIENTFLKGVTQNKFTLWQIRKYVGDERGFLSLKKIGDDNSIKITLQKDLGDVQKVGILLNDAPYIIEDNSLCKDVNKAYGFLVKKIGEEHIFCLRSTKMSPIKMLVFGDENSKKVLDIIKQKQNGKYPDPRIVKYEVEDETI